MPQFKTDERRDDIHKILGNDARQPPKTRNAFHPTTDILISNGHCQGADVAAGEAERGHKIRFRVSTAPSQFLLKQWEAAAIRTRQVELSCAAAMQAPPSKPPAAPE